MTRFAIAAAAMLAACAASPVLAEPSGDWHLSGKVSSFAFTLNCKLKLEGARLSGECQDASTNDPKLATGKVHPLTAGSVQGDHVVWTYQSSFLLTKFNVTYDGVQTGDRMHGTITTPRGAGAFTATRG
jgi:hypothetical protein